MSNQVGGVTSGRLTTLMAEQSLNTSAAETTIGTAFKAGAHAFRAGMVVKWDVNAKVTSKSSGPGTLTLKVYVHGVLVDTITTSTLTTSLSAVAARWTGEVQIRTDGMSSAEVLAGTSGLVVSNSRGNSSDSTLATAQTCGSTPVSVDLGSIGSDGFGQETKVTATFSVSDATNILLVEQAKITVE